MRAKAVGMHLEPDTLRLFVSDLPAAIGFYRDDLGLHLHTDNTPDGFAIFKTDGISLLIERVSRDDPEFDTLVGRFSGLSFRVDDVSVARERLIKLGVQFDGLPEKQPWGGTLAHFLDPDSNVLTLVDTTA